MSLMDDIRAEEQRPGPRCSVGTWITEHPELADEVVEALASEFTTSSIRKVIVTKFGFTASASTWRRHRKQECQCQS